MRGLFALLKEAASGWVDDNAARMGAALAYYAIFSLAPILVIAIAVAGFFFGQEAVTGQFAAQIGQVVGEDGAKAIGAMLANADKLESKSLPALISVVVLFFGAMGLFSELRGALNTIWKVPTPRAPGLWGFVRGYLLSLLMVLVIAILLFVLMLANAILSALGSQFVQVKSTLGNPVVNWLITWFITTLLFAIVYRLLPDKSVAWQDVWLGAATTAVLFSAGSWLIGLYLVHAGVGSVYGAAGSLAVLLTWLYYSAQVFLFGAELTKSVATRYGR